MTELVLASSSPTRSRLLEAAGIRFKVVPARIDEETVKYSLAAEGVNPRGIADALAELKARRVSASETDAFVIGADQVLDCGGRLLSKNQTLDEIRSQLRSLRGRDHFLITAVLVARGGSAIWRYVSEARLWMRAFSDEFLEDYLACENVSLLGSLGGYRLEGRGAQLFDRIEGDYFSILGLPLVPLLSVLRDQGALTQ